MVRLLIVIYRGREVFMAPWNLGSYASYEFAMALNKRLTPYVYEQAYSSSTFTSPQSRLVLNWPGLYETHRKIPTCLVYDAAGQLLNWGLAAKHQALEDGMHRCECFKLFLEPESLKAGAEASTQEMLPELPPGKAPLALITDFLASLWDHAKQEIIKDAAYTGSELESVEVYLTIPLTWNKEGIAILREAAIKAGLVQRVSAADSEWRERLHLVTEAEAAFVHCVLDLIIPLHAQDRPLKTDDQYLVCTAGGRSVEVSTYKVTDVGRSNIPEVAEMPPAKRVHSCGSTFLDARFRELVTTLLADHPTHTDVTSLTYFAHQFSAVEKSDFGNSEEGQENETIFHFPCFNVEDSHDPAVGLVNGELCIPGKILRREVFDPVVEEVIRLIDSQISLLGSPQALFMVGGFAQNPYLLKRVTQTFKDRIPFIQRPSDADTVALRGAGAGALLGLTFRPKIVVPRSYILKVRLPAEQEDFLRRPAYIKQDARGMPLCEKRLQYLVKKGAVVNKGEPVLAKFSKFSKSRQDSTFVTRVYTDTSDNTYHYIDEATLEELYRWTVDLSALPGFQRSSPYHHFYTEFEIGVEVENQDMSAVVLYNGAEIARGGGFEETRMQ
ncbi:hypothetical protein NLJ89_g3789 [Agrocybe chaxingu]|uniref:Actin-like ATPase domain-containing protein n=1 Tax=Agrocybe chaxingu TaxID=84603 RepID=A0A9W8MY51_9AGAR|nr:hypothetical protein NLJ89_g3789 [Agrocybe chaxingu]